VEDIFIGSTNYPKAKGFEVFSSSGIVFPAFRGKVGGAIYFNNKTGLPRVEICDVRTDGMLAAEFYTDPATSQCLPKRAFRCGHFLA